ncbi:urea ABC transporter permease subunit UrtB [Hespellia stercorisuis]|uniref:Urea transport system permease protein n=1 Tax=Hespellia stercorisuis DSM 15480 TaxID=1121950 RepID=A0A1M6JZE1_9FIRM|nr:urea ABC transporter permease subunit UrtB [Hespellia stercorisuis]SHJ52051.1 urea transport system permease protein [Hespellia stercorisuis DSM 15480]
MTDLITTLFNGLSLSSIYLLVALGLAVTFGLMGVINMAHGEFIMIGAYMTYITQKIIGGNGSVAYLLSIPVAFLITFLLGCILEKTLITRLYGRKIDSLLATWGISLILQQAARSIFGSQGVNVNAPAFLKSGLTIGGVTFAFNRIFIIGLVIVCLVAVWLLMNKTVFGAKMRATMQNRAMAQCMGINSKKIDCITFGLGSGLAGVAGCSVALLGSVDSTVGQNYIVYSFMTVVLGGVGNLLGTVIGAMIIGFSSIFVEAYQSASIARAIVLLIIIIFLQFKPKGLFVIRSRSLDEE